MGRVLALGILATVFAVAGVAKAVYPLQLVRVEVFLIPSLADYPLVAMTIPGVVAGVEVGLALALVMLRGRGALLGVLSATALLLVAFTGVLVMLLFSASAPACGCFGVPRGLGRSEPIVGLLRNAGLLCLLVYLFRDTHRPAPARVASGRTAAPAAARAFTVIEMMVAIAILVVTVALLFPALSHARAAARRSGQSHLVRQLTLSLTQYGVDNRDALPFFGTPGDALGPIRIRGFEVGGQFFTRQRWLWASAVYPEYLDVPRSAIEGDGRARHMQDSLRWPESIVASDYQLTSTAFAAPHFWVDREEGTKWVAPFDESLLRPTRFAEIRHASGKGLLAMDLAGPRGMGELPEKVVGMGDTSARVIDWRRMDPAGAVRRPWGVAGVPIEATRGGLGGVDF